MSLIVLNRWQVWASLCWLQDSPVFYYRHLTSFVHGMYTDIFSHYNTICGVASSSLNQTNPNSHHSSTTIHLICPIQFPRIYMPIISSPYNNHPQHSTQSPQHINTLGPTLSSRYRPRLITHNLLHFNLPIRHRRAFYSPTSRDRASTRSSADRHEQQACRPFENHTSTSSVAASRYHHRRRPILWHLRHHVDHHQGRGRRGGRRRT